MILWLIIFVLVIFHICTRYGRHGKFMQKIPGPLAYPLFGNLIMFNTTCTHEIWKITRQLTNRFYPITRIWFIKSALVSVRHPDDVEILLSSQKAIDKGYAYDFLYPWLKLGLLTSTGKKWRQRRKLLTPVFHFNILKKYLDIMNEEGEKCIDKLKNEGPETTKNLVPFTSTYTLNVICESSMGVNLDKMESQMIGKYKQAIINFGYVVFYRIPRPYIFNWMMIPIWKIGRLQCNVLETLHNFTNKIIRERRAYHKSTDYKYLNEFEDPTDENIDVGRKKRLAMLDLLLSVEKKNLIDNDGIKEEVDTFTFEGHDTTAMALVFTIMLLAENKEIQEKARIEANAVLNRTNGKLDITDLQELNYLERCVKESMRLYPPVSTIFRQCPEDIQLKHALIPAKTHIVVHFFDLHRDPNFWPDPDKFDPDRFLPEQVKNRHPFAYLPFSAGPRNCIGQKFAMMELKSVLARILHDFYLEPIDRISDMKISADIVIRPLDPIHTRFIKINK